MPETTGTNDDMHFEPQSADRLLPPNNLHADPPGVISRLLTPRLPRRIRSEAPRARRTGAAGWDRVRQESVRLHPPWTRVPVGAVVCTIDSGPGDLAFCGAVFIRADLASMHRYWKRTDGRVSAATRPPIPRMCRPMTWLFA